MPSAFFLAQTASEFALKLPEWAKKAWMACHFSSYGTGLSNFPRDLPEGSMVIVNDRIPIFGHDPERILHQLRALVADQKVSHVLLDFQRPGEPAAAEVARAIAEGLPCPVGITPAYAEGLDCAVCLPPLPPHRHPEDWMAPWGSRPLWMELAPVCRAYTINQDGCQWADAPWDGTFPHWDEEAKCHYRIEQGQDHICFTLKRGQEELELLRKTTGIVCFVGLYQEFAQPEAQDTALAQ